MIRDEKMGKKVDFKFMLKFYSIAYKKSLKVSEEKSKLTK